MKALLTILMVSTGSPLFAATAQQDAATTPNPVVVTGEQPRPPRQICRRVGAMSGSHVSRVRVCRTAAEWRAASDTSTDDVMDTLATLGNTDQQPVDGYTSERGGPGARPSPH